MVELPCRHILVASDGSADSERAFAYGLALALLGHGRLTLLHVMPLGAGDGSPALGRDEQVRWLDGGLGEMERRAAAAGVKGLRVLRETGLEYSRILERCEVEEVDLLVIGSAGWGGAESLGEVADRVVRLAGCSVLVVRQGPASKEIG